MALYVLFDGTVTLETVGGVVSGGANVVTSTFTTFPSLIRFGVLSSSSATV